MGRVTSIRIHNYPDIMGSNSVVRGLTEQLRTLK